MYCPWTGLGLYNGFRGNRWLRNRITIFKQFVVPSLQAQTNKNFTLWCSWRPEEKKNPYVKELIKYLEGIKEFKTLHTFGGVCFWDDKYPDKEAHERLVTNLHRTMVDLVDATGADGECDWVYMTIQPSDDCYHKNTVKALQEIFETTDFQAIGFSQGYVMNYRTKELAEWNPKTNPPFFTIKFPRDIFIDPLKHLTYTGPYKSHEYVGDKLKYGQIPERGFLVGTHSDNISTVFDHPYTGAKVEDVLDDFGLENVAELVVPFSLGRIILRKLPYKVLRKLRFLAGEKKWILRPVFGLVYNLLRS